jgi:hypothetical protein
MLDHGPDLDDLAFGGPFRKAHPAGSDPAPPQHETVTSISNADDHTLSSLNTAAATTRWEVTSRMREATRARPLCGPSCASKTRGRLFFSAKRWMLFT